jgi:tetratricopeptide (TPR) repeat protein
MVEERIIRLADKFSLLYQIDNRSPLFILIAYKKFIDGDIDSAASLIEKGLINFPDNPTALLIKAKIFIKKGNFSQALKLIKNASKIIGTQKTFDSYLIELETLNKQFIKIDSAEKLDASNEFSIQQNTIAESISKSTDKDQNKETSYPLRTDYDDIDDTMIISDTLAKIYFNQKEYKEAIRIYNKLKNKFPEKTAYYNSKISEIQALIEKF